MKTQIKAQDFHNRKDLENHLETFIEQTVEPKNYQITGTEAELKKLHLSQRTTLWGVRCVATDAKTIQSQKKPNRGKVFDFGINKINNKPT